MKRRGFTLLEVLVAVAILGLGLTVILSSQVGLFGSSQRARNLSLATNLVRCRMNEVEEKLLREGFPLADESDQGVCCDADEDSRMRCEWKIERIELPQPAGSSSLDEDGGAPGPEAGLESLSSTPLGGLLSASQSGGAALGENPSIESLADVMNGGGVASAQGMAPLVMGLVYPDLKPMLEASIRKVTVTISWPEGIRQRDLSVTQYLTSPQQGGFDPTVEERLDQVTQSLDSQGTTSGPAATGGSPISGRTGGGNLIRRGGN